MKSGIYYIQNIEDGKIYIGSAVNIAKRWREHKHHLYKRNHCNKHLQSVWDNKGEDIFIFGIMEIVSDKYALLDREQYWIDRFNATDNKNGYNKAPVAGSLLGYKQTEETKKKIGTFSSGRPCSKITKEKRRMAMTGKKLGEGHRQNCITAWVKRKSTKEE